MLIKYCKRYRCLTIKRLLEQSIFECGVETAKLSWYRYWQISSLTRSMTPWHQACLDWFCSVPVNYHSYNQPGACLSVTRAQVCNAETRALAPDNLITSVRIILHKWWTGTNQGQYGQPTPGTGLESPGTWAQCILGISNKISTKTLVNP